MASISLGMFYTSVRSSTLNPMHMINQSEQESQLGYHDQMRTNNARKYFYLLYSKNI